MPSQSDYTQLRTSEQSTSLNDEYHQSDSINDAPFGPDLRFIDTTLKQVAFAEVYVQVAQFVSKQEIFFFFFLAALLLNEHADASWFKTTRRSTAAPPPSKTPSRP